MLIIYRTLLIAAIGGALAYWAGLPSAWLIGAVLAVLMAAVSGVNVAMFSATGKVISLLLGVSVAQNIDDNLLNELSHWRNSVMLLAVLVACVLVVQYRFYRHGLRWAPAEALFCSIPGNLAITLSVAETHNVNLRRVTLVHSVRVCFLVTLLPLFFPLADRPIAIEGFRMAHPEYAVITLLCAWLGGKLLQRIKIPAPMLISGFCTVVLLKAAFGWHWQFPGMVWVLILVGLGASIGARFNAINLREVIPELKAAIGGLILMLVLSVSFAVLLWLWLDIPWLQALLAYAPGGMEVMIAIAINQQVDPVFVASHQMLRMLAMSLLLPLLLSRLDRT